MPPKPPPVKLPANLADAPGVIEQCATWLEDRYERKTAVVYLTYMRRIIESSLAPDDWFSKYLAGRRAPSTYGVARAAAAAYRRFLQDSDLDGGPEVRPIPPKHSKVRAVRVQATRRDTLTADQLADYERAVATAPGVPHAVRAILLLLPLTGLRIDEACSLRFESLASREGKQGVIVTSKNVTRWVPLSGRATKILTAYRRAQPPTSRFLFPGRTATLGDQHITPHAVREHLVRLRPMMGPWAVENAVSPHTLRHTFASRLLDRGIEATVVQTLLGHASIVTTSRYQHPSATKLAADITKAID